MILGITTSACSSGSGDVSSPTSGVHVTISVANAPAFTIGQASDGYPLATCVVSLTAQASGTGSAIWQDATFYWYVGLDRTKVQDSAVVQATDVRASWDSTSISSTGQEQGGWEVSDGLPFDLEIVFHYVTGASSAPQSARTRSTCGPSVPQGSVAPPTVSQVALAPQQVQWQPSDTMGVQFQASSSTGVWLTYAAFTGAFTGDTVFSEALQPSVQRLVRKQIPDTASLGAPAMTTIFAVDAFGQMTRQSIQTPALVDVTPPVLQLYMFASPYGSLTPSIGGTYFVGDSINFVPFAGDNHGLSEVVWRASPGSYGDSVAANVLNRPATTPKLLIPVRSDWNENLQFQFHAVDLVGNVSKTITTPTHAFKVYSTLSRPTVTGTVSGDLNDVLVDTARSVIYVIQGNQHRVAVLSLSNLQQTAIFALPGYPQSLDMTPGGDSLIVLLRQGMLAVIDLRQPGSAPSVVSLAAVDTLGGQYTEQARITANDRVFVARTGSTAAAHVLIEVNLATGSQRVRTDAGLALGLSRSLDQSTLMVAGDGCVARYDVGTDAFGPCTVMYHIPGQPSVDRTGQHSAIQLTAFDASLAPIVTVQSPWDLGSSWPPTIISADGAYLYYYLFPVGVIRARISDGAIMERTVVPPLSAPSMRLSPDGTKLLLFNEDFAASVGHLAVIDVRDENAQPFQFERLVPRTPESLTPRAIAAPTASRTPASATKPHWQARPSAPRPRRTPSAHTS